MKRLTFTLVSALMAVTSFGFQKQNTDAFTEISFGISGTAYVTKGSTHSVELKGDKGDLEEIKIEVKGDRLVIRAKNDSWFGWNRQNDIKVYITTPEVSYISVSGSGDLIGKSKFDTKDLKVSVSGSGHVEFEADADDVKMRISGSGSIDLSGTCDKGDLSISGSGRLDAEDLVANSYDISISGSGRCRINVKDEIDSHISGSGTVYYKGNPQKVNNQSSGSGKIKKI